MISGFRSGRGRISLASLLLAGAVGCGGPARALAPQPTDEEPAIIPRPLSVVRGTGTFLLERGTPIVTPAGDLEEVGQLLAASVARATGFALGVRRSPGPGRSIELTVDASVTADLGSEGYRLEVTRERVRIRGGGRAGVFYGTQSLLQLFPPEIVRGTAVPGARWTAPAVTVSDRPRFEWRGAHLDVGRHFMPVAFVRRFLDLMAMHKLNRYHWHLTEDQGWRIEIQAYPRLTEVGSCRPRTLVGRPRGTPDTWTYDGIRHCGFYTQADIREVVEYARARSITIVPEIEMPGHAQAALAAYPEFGNTGQTIDVWGGWGVSPHIFSPEPPTITFLQNVLTEVMALFPGTFIHIGGDEAIKDQWKASPRVQQRMKDLGLPDEHHLQSWFIQQMDAFLAAHGRRLIGWDEILEGGLAPGAAVMSWRGVQGGIDAARMGHDVVMAPTSHTYFDYYQSRDTGREPLAIGGFLPLDTVYAFEPVPAALNEAEARHILGAQAQHWTEYMTSPEQVEYMAFPRLVALAEVVWTAAARRDWTRFRARLPTHLERLDALGVHYRPLDAPSAPD